ncbi:hypothetical protein RintRC_1066 [Richelia intracellularis]|nr:hypothetical protein RintRC_1066 [Richelia intracellularis]
MRSILRTTKISKSSIKTKALQLPFPYITALSPRQWTKNLGVAGTVLSN